MTRPDANQKRRAFRSLHSREGGFIMPNPWDIGSARVLSTFDFPALATTSHGAANALGRKDGELSREEAIAHARLLDAETDRPISADLENGFGDDPEAAAITVREAIEAGLAGCSIEDYGPQSGLYDFELAVERIRAAVEANGGGDGDERLVLTARCENFLRGNPDLADTIRRLQAFQEAGADCLYAPALSRREDIERVLSSVDRPINVLLLPGGPSARELMSWGVARISVGSALATASYAHLVSCAEELATGESHEYFARSLAKGEVLASAWGRDSSSST